MVMLSLSHSLPFPLSLSHSFPLPLSLSLSLSLSTTLPFSFSVIFPVFDSPFPFTTNACCSIKPLLKTPRRHVHSDGRIPRPSQKGKVLLFKFPTQAQQCPPKSPTSSNRESKRIRKLRPQTQLGMRQFSEAADRGQRRTQAVRLIILPGCGPGCQVAQTFFLFPLFSSSSSSSSI